MEKQTPGAERERSPYSQFESHYPWSPQPPGDGDTPSNHKTTLSSANDIGPDLVDSWINAPNGAVHAPRGFCSEGATHKLQSRECTATQGHIQWLNIETYGPLLGSGGACDVTDGISADEISGDELVRAEEDTGEVLGVDDIPVYVIDELSGNTGCDYLPFSLNEKQHSTGPEIAKSGTPQCGCPSGGSDPQHLFSACRTCSCSVSCHHFSSEHGDDFCSDPSGSQDGREEEAQYEDGDPDEGGRRHDGEHCVRKKSGKRQRNRSATKEHEEGKEEMKKECRVPQAKHKAARKRSHVEGRRPLRPEVPKQVEDLAIFCVSSFRMFIDLVVFITYRCGEYVEISGSLLYTFCQLKTSDLDSLKASLQSTAHCLGQKTRSISLRLKEWGCSWGTLTVRLLKMLCALLFLVLMLFVGCMRLCWRHASSALMAFMVQVRGTEGDATHFASPPGMHFACRLWTMFREWRTCKYLIGLLRKWVWLPWTSKRIRTDARTAPAPMGSPSTSGRCPPSGEVERLLALADVPEEELNPFHVLGVEMNASDTELKKAYRQLAVLVHPDKNTHPRAEEAFKVVRAAWDIVSNPEKRKEYEIKRMSESELAKSMTELLSKLQDDLKEAMNTMMCSKCQGKHKRFEMERDPQSARYCAECNKSHPADEGDFWAESSMLGLKITYFAMMDGKVYDITEWAGCQRVGISPDTHRVPYHISFGSKNSGTTGRPRNVPESTPASAADLQDFFNRIFQGPPGPMPNGGLFSTPQQTPPPQGAPSPAPPKPDSVPKTETKPKRRKKVRRPFQR